MSIKDINTLRALYSKVTEQEGKEPIQKVKGDILYIVEKLLESKDKKTIE